MVAACSAKCKTIFLLIFLVLSLFSQPIVYAGSPKPVKVYASIFDILKAFWDALIGGFQNVMESVQNVTQEIWNTIYEAFRDTIDTFLGLMKSLWDGLTNIAHFIGESIITAGKVFVDTTTKFFGNWGDPNTYTQVSILWLTHSNAMSNITESSTLNDIAVAVTYDCAKKGVSPPSFIEEWIGDSRTISAVTPTGFLGVLSYGVFAIQKAGPIIEWVLRNIVLIHLAIIVGFLVFGLYASVQKRDIEPMVQAFHWIYSIFAFYGKAITWIISRAIDLAQAIAQWLDTIIPF